MPTYDEVYFLDAARKNALELGEVIKQYVPAECRAELMDALIVHIMQKNHNAAERMFRTFESGLMEGLIGSQSERTIDTIGMPRSGS